MFNGPPFSSLLPLASSQSSKKSDSSDCLLGQMTPCVRFTFYFPHCSGNSAGGLLPLLHSCFPCGFSLSSKPLAKTSQRPVPLSGSKPQRTLLECPQTSLELPHQGMRGPSWKTCSYSLLNTPSLSSQYSSFHFSPLLSSLPPSLSVCLSPSFIGWGV